MRDQNKEPRKPEALEQPAARENEKPAYEPPRILKKRSVARVTLFSGGGVTGGGITGVG